VPALRKAEEIRHAIRRAKSTEITDRLSALGDKARISVAVSLLGDRSAFALELGGHEKPADDRLNSIEGVGYHRKRKVALQIAEHMTNTDFVTAVLDQDSGKLTLGPSKFGSGLTRDEAKALIEHFAPLDQDRQYDSARLDALLQLDELHLDDRPLIALDDQDISGLSPGQRCTALLPLILLEGCPAHHRPARGQSGQPPYLRRRRRCAQVTEGASADHLLDPQSQHSRVRGRRADSGPGGSLAQTR
jgi:hypothetical protein